MSKETLKYLWLLWILVPLQSCIYEYPYASSGHSPGIGDDPTTVDAYIDVAFDLNWEELPYHVNFDNSTRAATDRPHRFILEVSDNEKTLCHDIQYLTDDEFLNGRLLHRLSVPLGAQNYHVTAWYDFKDSNGQHAFNADNLTNVRLVNNSTTDVSVMQCAYAHDILDLSDFAVETETSVTKDLKMGHPGARFEIIATDIQQFITDNKAALNQGDSFTVNLNFSFGSFTSFNTYSENVVFDNQDLTYAGHMRLPFAAYEELKIAEGFIFCLPEDDVTVKLIVTDSSLSKVCQTEYFSFPVKRGYITKVSGDFLTNSLNGSFSIDTDWEDEIDFEI